MLDELFNRKLQEEMTQFFLKELAVKGIGRSYSKGKIIDPEGPDHIHIVVKGLVSQELISENGKQMSLYFLPAGTIFGEMDYFDKGRTCSVFEVLRNQTEIALVKSDIVERELQKNPRIYSYFLHSIIRKHRILMLKWADHHCSDFTSKLANTLIRFAIMEEGDLCNGAKIRNVQSITIFAKYLHCSRSTLSTTLSRFKEEGILRSEEGTFVIEDCEKLLEYGNFVW